MSCGRFISHCILQPARCRQPPVAKALNRVSTRTSDYGVLSAHTCAQWLYPQISAAHTRVRAHALLKLMQVRFILFHGCSSALGKLSATLTACCSDCCTCSQHKQTQLAGATGERKAYSTCANSCKSLHCFLTKQNWYTGDPKLTLRHLSVGVISNLHLSQSCHIHNSCTGGYMYTAAKPTHTLRNQIFLARSEL